jgi:hypothetical protein
LKNGAIPPILDDAVGRAPVPIERIAIVALIVDH